MRQSKGLSEVLVAVILVVVAVTTAMTFYVFSQQTLNTVESSTVDQLDEDQLREKSGIYIENITSGDKVYIKNSGQVKMSVSSLAVFLNSTRENSALVTVESTSKTGDLNPGEIVELNVCHSTSLSGQYYVKVSGAYSTFDELLGSMNIGVCS